MRKLVLIFFILIVNAGSAGAVSITLTQGEESLSYLSWTGSYERSFASAEALGEASAWVIPRRIDFGAVDPGDISEREYTIKVPKNQKPGYYVLRWKYSCRYVSGKNCKPTNDIVLQITVKAKSFPTPTPVEAEPYAYLTAAQGEELSEYLTFTNNNDDTLYAWADASGDASSWVTPWRIDFGAIAPGQRSSRYYTLKVPEYISPGYYELIWTYNCDTPGITCTTRSPTVVQITVKAKPVLTPIQPTKTPSSKPAAVVLILIIVFIAIISVALKSKKHKYEAEVHEPSFRHRRGIGGRFQK